MASSLRIRTFFVGVAANAAGCAGCGGEASTLNPAGRDAEQIAQLFVIMAIGAVIIWAAVLGSAVYAVARGEREHTEKAAKRFIILGGVAFPTVVLTALLLYGLSLLPGLLHVPSDLRFRIVGEQWWWRVQVTLSDGSVVETANEIHLPRGERVGLALESRDVVHSFWIPSLAGKVDNIPGRVTSLGIEATRTGVFRGVCAEYCGLSHAVMVFYAVVEEPAEYDAWLVHQAKPAAQPASAAARAGATAFATYGCGACHAVRGTEANGKLGPDLTHVGSRHTIAGVVDNDVDGFAAWIRDPDELKPGAHMPAFAMIPDEDVGALAFYLESLQ